MTLFDDYMQKAGIIKEANWIDNPTEEPNDYYIPPAERKSGGVQMPQCMVESCYDKIVRDFLDRSGDHYKTTSDVMRAALVYFVIKIIAPAMSGETVKRAQAKAAMWRLMAEAEGSHDDAKMIETTAKIFARSKFKGEKWETFQLLQTYIHALVSDDRQQDLIATCESHPVFGQAFTEYRAYVKSKPIEGQEPYLDEVG